MESFARSLEQKSSTWRVKAPWLNESENWKKGWDAATTRIVMGVLYDLIGENGCRNIPLTIKAKKRD